MATPRMRESQRTGCDVFLKSPCSKVAVFWSRLTQGSSAGGHTWRERHRNNRRRLVQPMTPVDLAPPTVDNDPGSGL